MVGERINEAIKKVKGILEERKNKSPKAMEVLRAVYWYPLPIRPSSVDIGPNRVNLIMRALYLRGCLDTGQELLSRTWEIEEIRILQLQKVVEFLPG